jgi:hypothetical protein
MTNRADEADLDGFLLRQRGERRRCENRLSYHYVTLPFTRAIAVCEACRPGAMSIHRLDMGRLGELHRRGEIVLDEFGERLDAHLLGLDAEICQSLPQRRV